MILSIFYLKFIRSKIVISFQINNLGYDRFYVLLMESKNWKKQFFLIQTALKIGFTLIEI